MDPLEFEQQIWLSIIDKALLGTAAVLLGAAAARYIERYKSQRSLLELSLQKRFDTLEPIVAQIDQLQNDRFDLVTEMLAALRSECGIVDEAQRLRNVPWERRWEAEDLILTQFEKRRKALFERAVGTFKQIYGARYWLGNNLHQVLRKDVKTTYQRLFPGSLLRQMRLLDEFHDRSPRAILRRLTYRVLDYVDHRGHPWARARTVDDVIENVGR